MASTPVVAVAGAAALIATPIAYNYVQSVSYFLCSIYRFLVSSPFVQVSHFIVHSRDVINPFINRSINFLTLPFSLWIIIVDDCTHTIIMYRKLLLAVPGMMASHSLKMRLLTLVLAK